MVSGSRSLALWGSSREVGWKVHLLKLNLCPYYHQLQHGSCHQKGQRETLSHTPPVTENVRGLGRVAGGRWVVRGGWLGLRTQKRVAMPGWRTRSGEAG